jgi:mycoredoxin-dependent peroxiredoxin
MVETDAPAPPFTLADQHGRPTGLAEGGRGTLVVFFPYAFSGICGSELAVLKERHAEFTDAGVGLLTISTDPMYALRAYADAQGFEFPMLSDFWPHGEVARAYGVFHEERGCALRGSFLVDAGGVVRWRVVNGLGDARDPEAYRTALRALASAPARPR